MNSLLFCFLILLFATPLLSHQVVRYDGEKVGITAPLVFDRLPNRILSLSPGD